MLFHILKHLEIREILTANLFFNDVTERNYLGRIKRSEDTLIMMRNGEEFYSDLLNFE
jgi:hypothetical protein